jgi:nucleoside-diphosphate-sugar epimerase
MVHVEDLADLYVRAVESPYSGEVFNGTDRSRFTQLECARAAARAAGSNAEPVVISLDEARRALGSWAEGLALDQHVDSRKAVALLGWQPRHGGFVDGAARYYRAWRASQQP